MSTETSDCMTMHSLGDLSNVPICRIGSGGLRHLAHRPYEVVHLDDAIR